MPDLDCFQPIEIDIYTNNGNFPPLSPGDLRASGVNALVTGVFNEGSRARINTGFCYTHIIIVDTSVEIRDNYKGNSIAQSQQDYLGIPTGTTTGYWVVVFSGQVQLPGIGRKKIILADRKANQLNSYSA